MSTNGWATTLSEALSAAENYSAELSANDHQVNALKNMADSAMQLPDPKLKFGIENVPLGANNAGRLTREGMTMQRVGVMQDYVSSTKRERKADSITAEARQTAANADVIRARLRRNRQAWLALALAQKSLRSVQTLISETSRQIDVQKAGVSSASASPSSVLDVQLALNAMKMSRITPVAMYRSPVRACCSSPGKRSAISPARCRALNVCLLTKPT